jgi:hypothetical protein
MGEWLIIWAISAFLFMMAIGYAVGYRRWVSSYRGYLQRRNEQRAAGSKEGSPRAPPS